MGVAFNFNRLVFAPLLFLYIIDDVDEYSLRMICVDLLDRTLYVILPSIRTIGSFFTTISPVEEDDSCANMLVTSARV